MIWRVVNSTGLLRKRWRATASYENLKYLLSHLDDLKAWGRIIYSSVCHPDGIMNLLQPIISILLAKSRWVTLTLISWCKMLISSVQHRSSETNWMKMWVGSILFRLFLPYHFILSYVSMLVHVAARLSQMCDSTHGTDTSQRQLLRNFRIQQV